MIGSYVHHDQTTSHVAYPLNLPPSFSLSPNHVGNLLLDFSRLLTLDLPQALASLAIDHGSEWVPFDVLLNEDSKYNIQSSGRLEKRRRSDTYNLVSHRQTRLMDFS